MPKINQDELGNILLVWTSKEEQQQIADFLDRKFASKSEEKSKKAASRYFNNDHTHTSLAGARMNAQSVAKGLRDINSPLAAYLKKGK